MIDYVEMYDELDEELFDLESVNDEIDAMSSSYGELKGAHEIIQGVIDKLRDRLNEIEPLANEQERLEADAQRRDYFRGIGPL